MSMRDHRQGRSKPLPAHRGPSTGTIVFLGAVLTALLVAGGLLYRLATGSFVPTDALTLCPTDEPVTRVVIVLLDTSDGLSEPQILAVRNELDSLMEALPRFALVETYVVDRLDKRVPTPVLHICSPGTGEGMSEIYQNPDLARQRWKAFRSQLDSELDALMRAPSSNTSAIFEAIQATALRTFDRIEHREVPKELVIVSDLLQNVPGKFSHYDGDVPFPVFAESPYFKDVRADLSKVSIRLIYLVRPRAPQKWPGHYRFWEDYFRAQGANVALVAPVYGER